MTGFKQRKALTDLGRPSGPVLNLAKEQANKIVRRKR